jgi:NADH-quinone oxidoreductase subunit J
VQDAPFYASAAAAVGSALAAVTRRNPIYSALWLLISFVAIAVVFLDLHAPFLAAMHVLVYTGAILVLFLFVIMLLNLQPDELKFDYPIAARAMMAGLCALLGIGLAVLLARAGSLPDVPPPVADSFGGAREVGDTIFPGPGLGGFVVPFELVSVLIIAAMIGAVVIARPEKKS